MNARAADSSFSPRACSRSPRASSRATRETLFPSCNRSTDDPSSDSPSFRSTLSRSGRNSSTWNVTLPKNLSSPGKPTRAVHRPVVRSSGRGRSQVAFPLSSSLVKLEFQSRRSGRRIFQRTGNGAGIFRSAPRTMARKWTVSPGR